jgi:glycosyltransferase involved in cell wall biosynthesis
MAAQLSVSIVMPARNAAKTLDAAVRSIRCQTLTDWELVAVDDGSDDATHDLLAAFAGKDKRIRIISQSASGICAALQQGCAATRGTCIARMDADDLMHPERLRRQADFLKSEPGVGVVSCLVRHGGHPTAQAGYAAHVAWINSLRTPGQIALRRFVESPVAHPSVMFRRELLTMHGGYRPGNFPEDYELWLRWMDGGVRFGKVDAQLLTWNDPPDRLSRVDPRYRPRPFYLVKCVYLARWLKNNVTPDREIWLWGAGRITRQRFKNLEQEGISIAGFIDIDPEKVGKTRNNRPVVSPGNLPLKEQVFILCGVSSRGAGELISARLNQAGWVEGRDYLLAA